MKEKIIKREKGCYLKLPEEFRDMDEIELLPLKKGYYLLSVPIGKDNSNIVETNKEEQKSESVEERVLNKLESLGLAKRCPSYLKKVLSDEEGEMLKKLVKSRKVVYIHNKKFQEGIYVIEKQKKNNIKGNDPANSLANALFANGYIVLEGSKDAKSLSERLLKQKGSVLGIRGFDGKYYVVTTGYFQKISDAIAKMGDEITPKEVATKFRFSIEGCKAVLKLLSEKGDYLEKTGERFIRV